MLQNGEIIGGMYQIIREIGKGGTGVIYLGYHIRLQKQIVIKKIKDNFTGRLNARAEADILKRLHHTYLPQVYDFLVVGCQVYTVMDYIDGHDLQYYLDNRYSFEEKTLMLWMRQLCEVLEYLHTQQPPILHSDIKPGNIMITEKGDVCLIDFNISLDGEQSKEIQGLSQYYAAPEQYWSAMEKVYGTGQKISLDGRMDIYSLGAVFYRMMTGQYPDPRTGTPVPIMQIDIPYSDGLKSIVKKAVEFEQDKRFRTAGQMGKALDSIEKMDPKYRVFTRLQYVSVFSYALCILVGILMIYGGIGTRQKELWQEAYRSFYQASESGDESEIVSKGVGILNQSALRNYMEKHPKEKAVVLHTIGDSYFRQEDYKSAEDYYKETLREECDNAQYVMDFMAAMSRVGKVFRIEDVMRDYPDVRLNGAENCFMEAEIEFSQKKWDEALEKTDEALEVSTDRKLNAGIYELRADIFQAEEKYADAADAFGQAVQWNPERNLLRKAGKQVFDAGNMSSAASSKRAYYERALHFYELLCAGDFPSYEDRLNRALVLRAVEKFDSSLSELKELKNDYPEDYRILMWICYNCLDLGEEQKEISYYYHSCRHEYDRAGQPEDRDMEMLIDIMKERER